MNSQQLRFDLTLGGKILQLQVRPVPRIVHERREEEERRWRRRAVSRVLLPYYSWWYPQMALCFRSLHALNTADYERWLSALLQFCTNPLRHSGSMSEACLVPQSPTTSGEVDRLKTRVGACATPITIRS